MGTLDVPGLSLARFARPRRREMIGLTWPTVITSGTPTVTLGAASGATSITNVAARVTLANPERFVTRGGTYSLVSSNFYKVSSPTDPPLSTLAVDVAFATDDSKIEIYLQPLGTTLKYRLWVDGQIVGGTVDSVSATALGVVSKTITGGANYRLLIDFGSRAPLGKRAVRIQAYQAYFGGVFTSNTGVVRPPMPSRQRIVRVAGLGDSFMEGTNADAPFTGFLHQAGLLLGWDDIVPAAQGGTGFVNPGTGGSKTVFGSRVSEVIAAAPDVVFIAGGYNDIGYLSTTSADIITAATSAYNAIRAGLPTALMFAIGPWQITTPSATTIAVGTGLAAAIAAVGGFYIDNITAPWITGGSGNVASPTGTGNADFFVTSASDPHPPQVGHSYYGFEIAQAISLALAA